jgi:hypothetical protein
MVIGVEVYLGIVLVIPSLSVNGEGDRGRGSKPTNPTVYYFVLNKL